MPASACEHLVALAHQHTPESRKVLGSNIAEQLLAGGPDAWTDRERSLMLDILHKVVVDVEMSVRKTLSENLADVADAPPALIRLLADDDIEVAYPILTRSPVLADADLIEIVENRALEHQLAISMRYSVSEDVSVALVNCGQPTVIESLLRNENAQLSQATVAYLVEESKRVDTFREPLLRRSELGPDLAKRMFLWVSTALRTFIIDHFAFDQVTVDALLEKAAAHELEDPGAGSEPSGADILADTLEQKRKITPDMLIDALAQGEINLFVSMLGRITGLERDMVLRLLFEAKGEGLAVACKAVGLERRAFCSLLDLSRKARPSGNARAGASSESALPLFDATTREAASAALKKWQRTSDYMVAVRELKRKAELHG